MLKWLLKAKRRAVPEAQAEAVSRAGLLEQGLRHHREGRLEEAEAAYRAILATAPQDVDALHFLGVIAYQRGEYDRAAQWISRALECNASNPAAQNNLGNVLRAQGRLDEAIARYRRAIALAPDYGDAHVNLADALAAAGAAEQAIPHGLRARELSPASPLVAFKLGNLLAACGRLDEAIASYRAAIGLQPDLFEAHFNLGNALKDGGRALEALPCYREALRLKPDFALGHLNLGLACLDLAQPDQAAACAERAIALEPGLAEAHYLLGFVHADRDRRDEALACFRRALELQPEYPEAHWAYAIAQLQAVHATSEGPGRCRSAFAEALGTLERWFDAGRVSLGERAVGNLQPFRLAYDEQSNRDLLARYGGLCARLMEDWARRTSLPRPGPRASGGALRLAIVSRHLYDHSVWNAIVKGWFRHLDRDRFQLGAFYLGARQDHETQFARSRAATFEQGRRGLRQWAEAILARRPDVIIYPEVGMDPMTLRLASLRLAPVQAAA